MSQLSGTLLRRCPGKDGMSPPSLADSGQWTEPLALIRALPNCWQCYFRLRPSGQCFALLKIVPDDFLFAAIHGAYPLGQLKLLKIVPDDFFFNKTKIRSRKKRYNVTGF
ncbi:MAG: hypothetical protein KKF22_17795 [Gammaproteobacteria bacterium]|nr:hypothetical protein [Gammaproteobacteria bacterium]